MHQIRSDHLGGAETSVHVLLPQRYDTAKRYRVLYLLPVVCGEVDGVPAWGRPLDVASQHGFADAYNVIVVMATFPSLSVRPNTLYVNHPTRSDMQDEDYFCSDVVPLVDRLYSTIPKPCGRFLTGFCASGNGATWMLLRHLDMFGKSAVWETWLDLSHMYPPDVAQIGSEENFQQYCALRLIEQKAEQLRGGPTRLVILSCRPSRCEKTNLLRTLCLRMSNAVALITCVLVEHCMEHSDPASSLATSVFQGRLFDLQIPHLFELHSKEEHRWDTGWLQRAVAYLFAETLPENL